MKKNFFIRKNIILIILVRLKSKRLPQKAKLNINKFSLIEILIKRLIKHFPKKQIYICTSNKEKDNYDTYPLNKGTKVSIIEQQDTYLKIKVGPVLGYIEKPNRT